MPRILIVDDDPKLRGVLRRWLAERGFESEEAASGEQALERLGDTSSGRFALILLDVMLPGLDGPEVLRRLRDASDSTPTIFVTARDAVEERVSGLELGADDYVIKPFDFNELMARIEAVLRRREDLPVLRRGPLEVRVAERRVTLDGRAVELSQKELALLLALLEARGEVLERSEILRRVWGIDFDPQTNLVDVYVARLRRRLAPRGARMIQTVRGRGYRLVQDDED